MHPRRCSKCRSSAPPRTPSPAMAFSSHTTRRRRRATATPTVPSRLPSHYDAIRKLTACTAGDYILKLLACLHCLRLHSEIDCMHCLRLHSKINCLYCLRLHGEIACPFVVVRPVAFPCIGAPRASRRIGGLDGRGARGLGAMATRRQTMMPRTNQTHLKQTLPAGIYQYV